MNCLKNIKKIDMVEARVKGEIRGTRPERLFPQEQSVNLRRVLGRHNDRGVPLSENGRRPGMLDVLQWVGWFCTGKNCPPACPLFRYLDGYLCSVGPPHTAVWAVDCRIF